MPSENISELRATCQCGRRQPVNAYILRRLRENPHHFDGWRCPECRRGGVQRAPQPDRLNSTDELIPPQQTAEPTPQPQVDAPKVSITLDTLQANKNVCQKNYEDLYIGFELESDADEDDIKTALDFQYQCGKTNGITKKKVTRQTNDVSFTVQIDTDLYKESDLITQIYHDGSIGAEVVTRPVRLKDLGLIKSIHRKIVGAGGDCWSNGKGGCHMTFLTSQHKELSHWDKTVAKNVIQFARAFYKDLVLGFSGYRNQTRPLNYRSIPTYEQVSQLQTQHYTAVSLRYEGNRIWGIEIRFPDGSNDFDRLEKQAKFWSAVIRECAKISRYGVIQFSQERWNEMRTFYNDNSGYNRETLRSVGDITPQIKKILDESLHYYGYYDVTETETDYNNKKALIESALKGE